LNNLELSHIEKNRNSDSFSDFQPVFFHYLSDPFT